MHVVLPAILAPLEGCVVPRAVRQGPALQSPRRRRRLNEDCRTTASLPSDTAVQSQRELVGFSVAGDGGEESEGEKEERQGVG